ncbi:unnamed protein product [Amaranthus hypochondriacus]
MDNGRDDKTKPLISSLKVNKEVEEKVLGMEEREEESKRLLSPRNEEISPKPKRKVQWNDTNGGNKLAEVVEFLPSDVSDSDDDDDSDSCYCTIM